MSDLPKPRKSTPWPYQIVTGLTAVAVGAALQVLGERLWPNLFTCRQVGFFLFLAALQLLSMLPARWHSTWWGRAISAVTLGVWLCVGVKAWPSMSVESRRLALLMPCGLAIVAAVAWGVSRLPEAWRRKATSVAAGSIYLGATSLYFPGLAVFNFLTGKIGLGDLLGQLGLFVVGVAILGAGSLAVSRLSGWARNFTCFAIAGLVWTVGGAALLIDAGAASDVMSWALALVPPVIAGAVLVAYWRIDVASRTTA